MKITRWSIALVAVGVVLAVVVLAIVTDDQPTIVSTATASTSNWSTWTEPRGTWRSRSR